MFIETPVEIYKIGDIDVLVKREDMAIKYPAPPFSKVRGLISNLNKLKIKGFKIIGYTETSVSMAGWGVAWACKELGLKAIIFDPQYKKTPSLLKYHRKQWKKFDAELIPIKAGRAKVNWYISKKILQKYLDSILLPLGLPFEETVLETKIQAEKCLDKYKPKSIVVNVGSGTICSGIIQAANYAKVYGIMGRTGDIIKKKKFIQQKSGFILNGLLKNRELILEDPGWKYAERSIIKCPFSCHPYYDLKAWEWLIKNIKKLERPILFWNIGKIK